MDIRFETDSNGLPRVFVDGKRSTLSGYLEQDVQSDLTTVDLLTEICARVADGQLDVWEGTGNAHTVTIRLDAVRIENEISEDVVELSLEAFQSALSGWAELLKIASHES